MRILVGPRADEPLAGGPESGQQPEHRVRIPVGPAADRVDGGFDVGEVLADRAVLVEVVAPLVHEPLIEPESAAAQPLEPELLPLVVADDPRIGRGRVDREHVPVPGRRVVEQAPAHVVDVVRVAVVGRADGDHRLERGRTPRRDLEPVEPAPGDSDHADRAGAPGLRGDPVDDFQRVVLLLAEILAEQHSLRVSRPTHVDAHRGVAVPGEVRMGQRVALRGAVTAPIGQVLEDRRNRALAGVLRQPHPRREPDAVRQVDEHRIQHLGLVWKLFDDLHDVLPVR